MADRESCEAGFVRLFRSTHQQGAIFVLLLVQKANQSGGAIPAVVVRVTVLALSKGERPVVAGQQRPVGVAECGRPEAMV